MYLHEGLPECVWYREVRETGGLASRFVRSGSERFVEDRESVNGKLVKRVSAQWWMPRHGPARKDVASCEKPRGAASER